MTTAEHISTTKAQIAALEAADVTPMNPKADPADIHRLFALRRDLIAAEKVARSA